MGKKIKQKRIFIAATKQNDGKTTVSLGLIKAFQKRFKRVGFIKPVGQRYVLERGFKVDEDSVLIEKACGMKGSIKDMSPVAIEKGFTENYIKRGDHRKLVDGIISSFERISKNKDLVVIEGTGHAGVGSIFDLSNAKVANLLDAKVILIASGGIGKPMDEIELNMALFEREGVQVIGVIINKVIASKYKKVRSALNMGLKRKGIDVLGVIPYTLKLSDPTILNIIEETGLKLISRNVGLNNVVWDILIGAMEPHDALKYIKKNSLLITPGDREDMIVAMLTPNLLKKQKRKNISLSGIILTGGIVPNPAIMKLIEDARIPVLLSKEHTYKAASQIYDLAVKIRPNDKGKTKLAETLVKKYVDVGRILEKIK
ncbi:MAG: AAA family ATPase [Candidatus Omnitrophota bacterium]|nr:AAA family ATPase [Candidatus Omnitrophota bacterium]